MKRILGLFLIGAFIGCSSTPYEKLALKGYRESKVDSRFLSKEEENLSYYKYNTEDSPIYIVIEKNETTGELKPFLNLEYEGEDWLYIEKVEFSSANEVVEIDFLAPKFGGALTQDIPSALGNVKERILVPLTEDQVNNLEKVLKETGTTRVLYSSRYRNGESKTSLSSREQNELQKMIELYNKVKGEKINGN